jgi:hypothetical protein
VGVPFPAIALEIMRGVLPARHLAEMIYGAGRSAWRTRSRGVWSTPPSSPGAPRRGGRGGGSARRHPCGELHAHQGPAAPAHARLPRRHAARIDDEALACWSAPPAQAAIRRYVEKTLGGGRR